MAARGFVVAWRISQHAGFTVVRGIQHVCAEPYVRAFGIGRPCRIRLGDHRIDRSNATGRWRLGYVGCLTDTARTLCLPCRFAAQPEEIAMKKSRGGRMTAAKKRAAKAGGGAGLIKNRKAGKKIMKT